MGILGRWPIDKAHQFFWLLQGCEKSTYGMQKVKKTGPREIEPNTLMRDGEK